MSCMRRDRCTLARCYIRFERACCVMVARLLAKTAEKCEFESHQAFKS